MDPGSFATFGAVRRFQLGDPGPGLRQGRPGRNSRHDRHKRLPQSKNRHTEWVNGLEWRSDAEARFLGPTRLPGTWRAGCGDGPLMSRMPVLLAYPGERRQSGAQQDREDWEASGTCLAGEAGSPDPPKAFGWNRHGEQRTAPQPIQERPRSVA